MYTDGMTAMFSTQSDPLQSGLSRTQSMFWQRLEPRSASANCQSPACAMVLQSNTVPWTCRFYQISARSTSRTIPTMCLNGINESMHGTNNSNDHATFPQGSLRMLLAMAFGQWPGACNPLMSNYHRACTVQAKPIVARVNSGVATMPLRAGSRHEPASSPPRKFILRSHKSSLDRSWPSHRKLIF